MFIRKIQVKCDCKLFLHEAYEDHEGKPEQTDNSSPCPSWLQVIDLSFLHNRIKKILDPDNRSSYFHNITNQLIFLEFIMIAGIIQLKLANRILLINI